MKLKIDRSHFYIFNCVLFFLTFSVYAEEDPVKPSQPADPCDSVEERVTNGNAATMGVIGNGSSSVDSDAGGAAPGDKESAVTAAVNSVSDTKCEVKFSNSSKCFRYLVNYEINSSKAGNTFVSSSSVSLEPGSFRSSNFTCKQGLSYSVKITKSTGSKVKKSK